MRSTFKACIGSVTLLLLCLSACVPRQEFALRAHVDFLSDRTLEGRGAGSLGEARAATYVASIFRRIGLLPAGENGSYFQRVSLPHHRFANNVLARLPGNQKKMIVVGAHLDHLGRGQSEISRASAKERGMIHPGADDNASGIACMLMAATQLYQMKKEGLLGDQSILFAAWTGEEIGLIGSSYFVKHMQHPLHQRIDAYINLDMVGRFRKKLVVQGRASSRHWQKILMQANATQKVPLVMQADPYLPTDSTAFYLQGVPSLNLFTGAHAEYHTPRDLPATLNYEGMAMVTNFLVRLIVVLEQYSMDYQRVAKKNMQGGGLKVYLGTIPDYSSSLHEGVKLSGVIKDSPAEHAGIKANDRVIRLAGRDIHDIYDYTRVMNRLLIGRPTSLTVIRGRKRVELIIIARARNG